MDFSSICSDPENIDLNFPSDMKDVVLESSGKKLFGVLYTPQGKGPHPTVLLLHGFPGSERNFDLAQILRRAGCNVMVFHYRGSWGSEGDFSFSNVLEDTELAVDFLHREENISSFSIDPERFVLMGHSMGGFSTLMTGMKHPDVSKMISIAGYNLGAVAKKSLEDKDFAEKTFQMFTECVVPLKGTGTQILLDEIKARKEDWDVADHADEFKGKKVLLIAGSRDTVSEPSRHHAPLVDALKGACGSSVEECVIDDTHSFHGKRIALAKVILEWFHKEGILS